MSPMPQIGPLALRVPQLLVGLVLYGFALAMGLQSGLGVAPWSVLSQGIALHTGLSYGWITELTSIAVLGLWIPLRERPGVGTVANTLLIGPAADLGLAIFPPAHSFAQQLVLLLGGIVLLAIATGLYLGASFGPGPRDGLMTGLVRVTPLPVGIVRTGIEMSVLIIGWLLGGSVGLGTVACAVLTGPLVAIAMRRLAPAPAHVLAA